MISKHATTGRKTFGLSLLLVSFGIFLILAVAAFAYIWSIIVTPYSNWSVEFCAVKDNLFYVVVQKTSGVYTTIPGPCPKSDYYEKEKRLYKLTYQLTRPRRGPEISPPIELQPEYHRRHAAAYSMSFDWICLQFDLPRAASLYCDASPMINYIEEKSIPTDELTTLKRLGFITSRSARFADIPAGRWYLGFDPFSPGVQVCCPKQGILYERELEANGASIWDPDRSRLVLLADKEHYPLIGLPTSITIWDYQKNSLASFDLAPVTKDDLP